jgi:hypothetical protein
MEIEMTIECRKHFVMDASARVFPSRNGDWLICFDADGGKFYRFDSGMFLRELAIETVAGTVGAFRHDQFRGTFEAAIICDDGQIRRFDILSKTELPPISVPGASALEYSAGGDQLMVGTVVGEVHVFTLQGDNPRLLKTQAACEHPVERLVADPFGKAVNVLSEGAEHVMIAEGHEPVSNEMPSPITAYTHSPDSPAYAIALREGILGIFNWENGAAIELEVDGIITDLCFLSSTELAIAFEAEVLIIHLDRLGNSDSSATAEPPTNAVVDGFRFNSDGQQVEILDRLSQPADAACFEPVYLPNASRIHGVRRGNNGQTVVIFE